LFTVDRKSFAGAFGVKMIPVQVRITKKIVEEIDLLVQKGIYSNRSEVIRDATRRHVMDLIKG